MIKTLFGSLREYKKPSLISIIFALGEVACEVFIAFLMGDLLDLGVTQGNIAFIIKIGIILISLSLVAIFVGSLSGVAVAKASSGFSSNLRKDSFYKLQSFSFKNIDKFSTSSIITRLTTDINNIQMSYFMILRMATRTLSMIVFASIMAYNVHKGLSAIFLVLVPIMSILLFLIINKVYPIFSRVFMKYDNLNQIVQENLRGIRVVKAFVREKDEINKFGDISNDIYKDFAKAEKLAALNFPLLMLAIYTAIFLIAWRGAGYIVTDGSMTTGDLFSMISFSFQILINILMLASVIVMIAISRNSAERVAEILNEKSTIESPQNPINYVKGGSISFENVSFSYSENKDNLTLFDINVDIESGETIGIIGSTGSSKTTLIQLIPRLYDATIGKVKVGGVDVKDYDLITLRNKVAVVLQKNVLFSGTVRENLSWGNINATEEEMIKAAKLAQAHNFVAEMEDGYDSRVEQGGSNFSGGQRQRLCIARALLKKPDILILDDSTSAVDTKTDRLIRNAMYDEIPETTKIIIAQRISSVEHADRIIILENGRIEDIGNHNQLLERNKRYKGLYDSQIQGGAKIEE